jgi:single-strand DNA-binding protein
LVLERWTDQNGQNRSKHVIQADTVNFMETRAEANNSASNSYNNGGDDGYQGYNDSQVEPYKPQKSMQNKPPQQIPEIDIDDDEIPF